MEAFDESIASEVTAARVVELSKKNRALNLALEREKTSVQQLKKELIAAREQRPSADREGDSSGFAREISTPSSTAAPTSTEEQLAEAKVAQEKLQHLQSRVEKAERESAKLIAIKVENEKLRQALKREVGEDTPLDKVIASGGGAGEWRGRSQQIIALKDKLRELKAQAGVESQAETAATRAQKRVLEGMEESRQEKIQALELELATIRQEVGAWKTKAEVGSSRAAALEKELRGLREKASVLAGKSEQDDRLVDALRRALEQAKLMAGARGPPQAAAGRGGQVTNPKDAAEISQLRASVTVLQQQIMRQEQIIRELHRRVMAVDSSSVAAAADEY